MSAIFRLPGAVRRLATLSFAAGLPAVIALGAAVVIPASTVRAEDARVGALEIRRPWSRATPGHARVGAGYLTIANAGSTPDRLVSATAEVAGRVEIHDMTIRDNVMVMRPLADGIVVPPAGSLVLAPGSYHIMFLDLARSLKQGETFAGTLTFEKAGTVVVRFAVEGVGAGGAHDGRHGQHTPGR